MFGIKHRHNEILERLKHLETLIEEISSKKNHAEKVIEKNHLHLCQHYENLNKKIDRTISEREDFKASFAQSWDKLIIFIQKNQTAIEANLVNIFKGIEKNKITVKAKKPEKMTKENT